MKKASIFIIILVIFAIVGVASIILVENGVNDNNKTSTNKSVDKNVTDNKTNGNGKVEVVQSAPSSVKAGDNITVKWTVTNRHSTPITNVNGVSQYGDYDFGTIAPGESKSTTFTIPSQMDISGDGDLTVESSSLYIGGFSLEYDLKGKHYQVNSNNLDIKLT